MTREQEKELIEKTLDGDHDAFGELLCAHQKKIYNLTLRMTGNAEDAADLTQETFLKAYRSLGNFRFESSFSVWLYRMASNLCVDFFRQRRRRETVSMVYLDDEDNRRDAELPDTRHLPEEELERREVRDAVARGLLKLTDEHREIMILREINGLSYLEISKVLELEEGTVKSRISRARAALREILVADGNISAAVSSKITKGGGTDEL